MCNQMVTSEIRGGGGGDAKNRKNVKRKLNCSPVSRVYHLITY